MGKNYLRLIKEYNIHRALPQPEKAALLVIDMQLKFKEVALSVLGNVISLVNACTKGGVKTFFTRQGNRNPMTDGGMLSTWWGDITRYGSPEWELLEELRNVQNGILIDKRRYDAFFGTELDKKLRDSDIRDIIICGVTTNCCCETTAREAFVRDYRVFFVADATATANEELHLASLKNLAYGFAYIVDSENICKALLGTV